ncbi:TonB-dependent siderophore receptor [Dysgonomonas macrotermitis]|uniref:Iron complex outermembrane recepter protein n=1 Tax=Dysgonomonas macrotermitis TaxID=1346286 RepID=A0A1M4TYT6_9BACT|nr:TonB-dependent siderophore receptor [Dysgonomonas macrotermitis]SHE49524.1 iron complex outermembrane recepter protein [Dysgonomonas macrotermitis]
MSRKILFSLFLLFICIGYSYAQKVKGYVYDENGDPLTSATVVIEGSNLSALTDDNGAFIFKGLPRAARKITVSYIGYKPNTQNLEQRSDMQRMRFDMEVSNALAEVEVFGERYKQPEKLDAITRMPLRPSEQIQTISVISEKVITEQGALTITDAVRNVPGVTLFGSYGGVKESMSTRGFRGIPVLKNGVRIDSQFQTASGVADMQGVESIQMIKGSAAVTQGVITDLGNAGGVINVVTKTPKFVNAGQVDLRVGSWGQVRPTFDVQSVLDSKRTVAFRLNGAYERADNYRPVVSANKAYINPSLEWRPDDRTTINLEMDYLNADVTPVSSTVNLGPISEEKLYDMPHSKYLGFNIENNNTRILTYSARINRMLTKNLSIRAAYFNSSYNVDNTSSALSDLKNPTNYEEKVRKLSRSLRDDKNSTFQLDFIGRDVYTGSLKHTFQIGFDYRIADATTTNMGSITVDTINVVSGNITRDLPKDYKLTGATDPVQSKYTTYGIMAQEVLTINKYLKAILGLRYSSISTVQSPAGNDVRDAWDPMVGVMISPIENINVFASYTTSTSLRSAANKLDSVTEAGPSRTKQFEVGIKSDWLDNRLRFNFTYFHIYTDNLTNTEYYEGTTTATGYVFKAGDLKRDGIEVELNGRILPNLQVMLGYSYLHARYEKSPSYVNGSAPMNAPKHTANGWINYAVDRGALKGLSAGVGVYYVGKRPVNEYSNAYDGHNYNPGVKPFDMPAYTTVNAQLAYKIGHVTTRVFFNNIFDALGYNSYYRGGYINQIDPRNFAAQVSYSF